ncbi:MAG: hypothetical protein KC912_12695 [Proteobacteria bacterium]|nr:hypothetical protein [Pseudomonadota bacterium]
MYNPVDVCWGADGGQRLEAFFQSLHARDEAALVSAMGDDLHRWSHEDTDSAPEAAEALLDHIRPRKVSSDEALNWWAFEFNTGFASFQGMAESLRRLASDVEVHVFFGRTGEAFGWVSDAATPADQTPWKLRSGDPPKPPSGKGEQSHAWRRAVTLTKVKRDFDLHAHAHLITVHPTSEAGVHLDPTPIRVAAVVYPPWDRLVTPEKRAFPPFKGPVLGHYPAWRSRDADDLRHLGGLDASQPVRGDADDIREFFRLAEAGFPSYIDALFCPEEHVRHSTVIGDALRAQRQLFLSRKYLDHLRSAIQLPAPYRPRDAPVEDGHPPATLAHTLRWAFIAARVAKTGVLSEELSTDQQAKLAAIAAGEWSIDRFREEHTSVQYAFLDALPITPLPKKPSMAKLQKLCAKLCAQAEELRPQPAFEAPT